MTSVPVKQVANRSTAQRVRPRLTLWRWRSGACARRTCSSEASLSRGRTAGGCLASDRLGLACGVASIWPRRTACRRSGWPAAEAEPRALAQVEVELAKGAEANGYVTDL